MNDLLELTAKCKPCSSDTNVFLQPEIINLMNHSEEKRKNTSKSYYYMKKYH